MGNIILLVGPPGCGKTTWAKLYVQEHIAKRINRDDLREMMYKKEDDGLGKPIFTSADEKVIKRIRNYTIESWLQQGYDVVVDDTNLDPYVFADMQQIARRIGDIGVREHVFTLERAMCKHQNEDREEGVVPEARWNEMWEVFALHKKNDDYYAPPIDIELMMNNEELKITKLPKAVIVDIDNTIAMFPNGRGPFEHKKIPNDIPNGNLLYILDIFKKYDIDIILVSGRSEDTETATRSWFADRNIWYDFLYMRPAGEEHKNVKDYIIKKKIYEEHIKGVFFVLCAFEDREQTTVGWRDLGVPVHQINFGRY